MRFGAAILSGEPLGVLELREGRGELERELATEARRGAEVLVHLVDPAAGGFEAGTQPQAAGIEQGREQARGKRSGDGEQLFGPGEIGDRERGFDRLHERGPDVHVDDREGLVVEQRECALGSGKRLGGPAVGTEHTRCDKGVDRPALRVVGVAQRRAAGHERVCPVELAALGVDQCRVEQPRARRLAGGPLVRGNGERLVPSAEEKQGRNAASGQERLPGTVAAAAGDDEQRLPEIERVGVAIAPLEDLAEVVPGPQLAPLQLLSARHLARRLQHDASLHQPSRPCEHDPLAGEGLDEHLGQLQPLGEGECALQRRRRLFVVAEQGAHPAQPGERRRQLAARPVLFELTDRLRKPCPPLIQAPFPEIGVGEQCAGARRRSLVAGLDVERDRPFEPFPSLRPPLRLEREPARLLEQRRLARRVFAECCGLVVVGAALRRAHRAIRPVHRRERASRRALSRIAAASGAWGAASMAAR